MREIVLQPEPLLHQLEHVTPLQLGVFLRDGLLQLGEEALSAEATHTGLTVVLAAFSGSAMGRRPPLEAAPVPVGHSGSTETFREGTHSASGSPTATPPSWNWLRMLTGSGPN